MQLVRTLALAATAVILCAGRATAQDVPTTAPPTTPPSPATPSNPSTPTPTNSTPVPMATTAGGAGVAKLENEGDVAIVSITSSLNKVMVEIADTNVTVKSGSDNSFPTNAAKMRVIVNNVTTELKMSQVKSNVLTELEIGSHDTNRQAVVLLPSDGLQGLTLLSSLTFTNIKFKNTTFVLKVPPTLAYLKLNGSDIEDLSLSECNLYEVDVPKTGFKQLPYFLYERNFTQPIAFKEFNIEGGVTKLSQAEYDTARHNLGDAANLPLTFQPSCNDSASSSGHIVCQDTTRVGLRELGVNTPFIEPTATPTPAPTPRGSGSSSNTTLTVIVIVIAIVAAVLAYFVARRYFCTAKSLSRSPRLNERTVGLISKDEPHAGNNKLSFISSDDALRQIRLEQQDVSVTKSVGTGRLWVGDYSGRKVMIKRVEAESSDSYATKALITQARALAPVSHPNIVSLVGVTWVQGTDFGVVGEFMEKGALKAVLMDLDAELDLQSKLQMCLDIAQALKYLHSSERNMYMKRLTSRKVLVNGAIECKLNLYECHPCTNKIEYPEVFGAGEMAWEAPELITRTGVLDPRKINIFSLGVIIGEIMTRASPYQSAVDAVGHTLADLELMKRIKRQERLLPHENRHEFKELPAVLRDVVDRCLSYQPLSRPTAEEVVQCLESVKDYSERIGSTTSL